MSGDDFLSILLVAGVIAAWKILTMSNIPWWACTLGLFAYVLLLIYDRMHKTKGST